MLPITPRGFKDVLPAEARWRENIISRVKKAQAAWGYAPIETPTLEVLEVLELGGALNDMPFRLFDADNALLVLRPDVTLPVARMVATRLGAADLPLRFRYVQSVFSEAESLRATAREFTQVGVESIGLGGCASDAEIVRVCVESLEACGLEDFTVAICTVAVLNDLLDRCVHSAKPGLAKDAWRAQMLAAFHSSNLVAIEQLSAADEIDQGCRDALRILPTIHGGAEAIRACQDLTAPLGCASGLDDLAACWSILEGIDGAGRLRVDFSTMRSFDYYTGLVLEAFAPSVGRSLGGGGRYDNMLAAFGVQAPAAGFALCLETVLHALYAQGIKDTDERALQEGVRVDCPFQGPHGAQTAATDAFKQAIALHAAGSCAILDIHDGEQAAS